MGKQGKSIITQIDLVKEFYENNPMRDVEHEEVVDWLTREYMKRTGKVFRDPDRAIRSLYQKGFLIKVKKGIYRYDPLYVTEKAQEDFSQSQKKAIMERDEYKCVICGLGEENGIELHIDHIRPKDLGGKATIENGQTLCSRHNFLKKNFKQTETGKKMFIQLYNIAKSETNEEMIAFCKEVLEVFNKHNVNGHIEWKGEEGKSR